MSTNIYGLFDPRTPDVVMYVGKGLEKRSEYHWKCFLTKGTAVNALLRHWFEKLKNENVTPSWRFLEENVVNWQEREKFWIAHWRDQNSILCNVASGGNTPQLSPEERSEVSRRGIRRAHELHPELAYESGKIAGKVGGPIGGKRVHELYPEMARNNARILNKRPERSEWSRRGGQQKNKLYGISFTLKGRIRANHNRWHVARGIKNLKCSLCQEIM